MKSLESLFPARFLTFDNQSWEQQSSLRMAAELVRDKRVAAVLLDIVPAGTVRTWWNDSNAGASLDDTRFFQLFARELAAQRVSVNAWERFLSAARSAAQRDYANVAAGFGDVAPSDDWDDSGDVADFLNTGDVPDRLNAFLTVQAAANQAGVVLWDELASDADGSSGMSVANAALASLGLPQQRVASLTVRPAAGQLCLFNNSKRHAMERCSTTRLTMGTFLVHHDERWTLLD